jgi:hypothetical protein
MACLQRRILCAGNAQDQGRNLSRWAAAYDSRVEGGHIGQPLHPRMSAMRISVPIIDTTMEPMHPTLLEKNPNMAKKTWDANGSRPAPFGR